MLKDIFSIKNWHPGAEVSQLTAMMTAGEWYYATSDLTYDSNLWYNIVIVRELTSLKIYVDGNLTGSNEVNSDYNIVSKF